MKRRAARLLVVLVFAAIAGAATHQAITRYRSIDAARGRLSTIDAAAAQADLALIEIAASQRGYVAPGQGVEFWTARADESLASARGALNAFSSIATDAGAAAQAASALSRLDDLAEMDRRVRDYVTNGQRGTASDLIFADGYEMIAAARADAASAAAAERAAAAGPLARDRQLHVAAIAALAICAAVPLLLLLRAPKEEPALVSLLEPPAFIAPPATHVSALPDDSIGAALDASLAGLDDLPGSPALPDSPAPLPGVSLSEAADVCVDLGRLLDARDLQSVLARIAGVLEADGLIVWMTDRAGQTLAPALTHGYAPAMMARVGTLSIDADNATAAAWRAKTAQVVRGEQNHPGALAVPLLTSGGCVGVLAVELKNGRERAADVQSLARIVAAQLASSISPAGEEPRQAAEA